MHCHGGSGKGVTVPSFETYTSDSQVSADIQMSILIVKDFVFLLRDIKLENLILNEDLGVKLCDLGSASTKQHYPDQNWSMNQRTVLEDKLVNYSTL